MRIKIMIVSAIMCLTVISISAQNVKNRFHLYGSADRRHINGYIGPHIAFSTIEGSFAADIGISAGVLIHENFFLGIYGQKLLTSPARQNLAIIGYPTFTNGEIKMIHAGGVLGYIHSPGEIIHWGISSSAGLGEIYLYAKDPVSLNTEQLYNDRVVVVIPKVFLELNMSAWFKVNVSAGYRVVGMINGTYINQADEVIPTFGKSDYSKPEFSVSFLFGAFGIHSGLMD
jgi:hypothetical protein